MGDTFSSTFRDSAWKRLLAQFFRPLNTTTGLRFHPRTWFFESIKIALRNRVAIGPFRGMHYVNQSVGSTALPKLLGTYEQELHPLLTTIHKFEFERIVDVGAAEGYYAVGLAKQFPRASVVAFETESLGRQLLAKMAVLNCVSDQLEIRGKCEQGDFRSALLPIQPTLVVMDVEGYEAELLDPAQVQPLRTCHILLEVHDCIVEGVGDVIKQRFQSTHAITTLPAQRRELIDAPGILKWLNFYPFRSWVLSALNECRPLDMYWFYLEPLNHARGGDHP